MNKKIITLSLLLVSVLLSFTFLSCNKSDNNTITDPINFFDNNVINKDLSIHLAVDNGSTITSQFNGYILRFTKNAATSGNLLITNSLLSYNGTWTTTSDHTTLSITLPVTPNEFSFLNRQWKFTRYTTPIMELSPLASGDNKVLHFQIQ